MFCELGPEGGGGYGDERAGASVDVQAAQVRDTIFSDNDADISAGDGNGVAWRYVGNDAADGAFLCRCAEADDGATAFAGVCCAGIIDRSSGAG